MARKKRGRSCDPLSELGFKALRLLKRHRSLFVFQTVPAWNADHELEFVYLVVGTWAGGLGLERIRLRGGVHHKTIYWDGDLANRNALIAFLRQEGENVFLPDDN